VIHPEVVPAFEARDGASGSELVFSRTTISRRPTASPNLLACTDPTAFFRAFKTGETCRTWRRERA
jgi:hypothetical protein